MRFTVAEDAMPTSKLLSISTELQLMIFKLLDPASSTCLGLTNKAFYQIHWGIHGKVSLSAYCMLPPNQYSGVHLWKLLEKWVGRDMIVDWNQRKFLASERHYLRFATAAEEVRWNEGLKEIWCGRARYIAEREMGGYYHKGVFRERAIFELKTVISNRLRTIA